MCRGGTHHVRPRLRGFALSPAHPPLRVLERRLMRKVIPEGKRPSQKTRTLALRRDDVRVRGQREIAISLGDAISRILLHACRHSPSCSRSSAAPRPASGPGPKVRSDIPIARESLAPGAGLMRGRARALGRVAQPRQRRRSAACTRSWLVPPPAGPAAGWNIAPACRRARMGANCCGGAVAARARPGA